MAKQPHSRQTREQRADLFFALYAQMSTGRSLNGLVALANRYGLAVSHATLARYSHTYSWQERIAKLEAEDAAIDESPAGVVARMNTEQAAIGRGLLELAGEGLAALKGQGAAFGPLDVARLAKVGMEIERLARGEATTRHEITFAIYAELVPALVVLVNDAFALGDLEEIRRQILIGLDALVEAQAQGLPLDARIAHSPPALPPASPAVGG